MRPVWPKLVALNLNTVLVPVYWELIEPVEGKLDFTLVDGLIQEARKHGLRLAPLWFASWKNSMSCYAPAWVKTNQQRFPRAEDKAGNGLEILSPFSQENLDADARAFAAFMRHLREVDGRDHTVIMVQVENEIGMIPDSRDRSAIANKIFNQSAPPELMNYLERRRDALMPELRAVWAATNFKTRGTWEEVFGPGVSTDEIFMAWHFARYANRVAELGKAEYPLPMFVNAALIRPGYQPGQYSSGGPLPHLMDVWRAGAPQIDFLSPDIYFTNFADWCRKYHKSGNPLFIPEAILGPLSAVNALYAIGQHDAIGFSPFSIESVAEPARSLLAGSYDVLTQLAPLTRQGSWAITVWIYFSKIINSRPNSTAASAAKFPLHHYKGNCNVQLTELGLCHKQKKTGAIFSKPPPLRRPGSLLVLYCPGGCGRKAGAFALRPSA